MEKFDVVIVGGGPAGLICAKRLAETELRVLLLEKNNVFGGKVCAGGLTRKGLSILDIPDEIIQHKIHNTALHSIHRSSQAITPDAIAVTVDRKDLGRWQRSLLQDTHVEIRQESRVVEIRDDRVVLRDGTEIGYGFLVGADGYASVVRRFLGLPQDKTMIGIQYQVPMPGLEPRLEIFLDSRNFNSWYGWKFPHKDILAVGCGCDPRYYSPKKLKENFHAWLNNQNIDVSRAIYQSAPISYDYRGLRFGNIFLVGDAAGIASGLTGEGIYQSLVTGIEVAGYILGQEEESAEMKAVIRYNRIQERIMKVLIRLGPLRRLVYELIIILMNNKRFKNKVNNGFS
ncbi:MAG TPA: NAD(P)/FAD-dependent oxidoreductase [Bacteroidales bacterium]|nr:NAD(P)/FAD-dependent oxidoreductase [Bacteroidales bacterium]